jgi:hypothetical protein
VRDIEESRAIEVIRGFLESPVGRQRAVTSEWLAGRLGIPLPLCEAALGRLVSSSLVRRLRRSQASPVYIRGEPHVNHLGLHFLIAMLILVIVTAAMFFALNWKYILLGAEALAIGLIIAFAWLDAELRDPRPPQPPS